MTVEPAYYRGMRFIKAFLGEYLSKLFYAYEKESRILTDGTKKIEFSRRPYVKSIYSWEEQELPAVLIAVPSTEYKNLSIAKDLKDIDDYDAYPAYRYYGGDIIMDIRLTIRAKSAIERDNLTDIVCLYLSHPEAKTYFLKQGIAVEKNPRIAGETVLAKPSTVDYKIYENTISYGLRGVWDYRESLTDALVETIVTSITLDVDFE